MKLAVALSFLALAACIPTAGRKNARVNPGFDIDVAVGGQYTLEGKDENDDPTEVEQTIYGEVDLQWGTVIDSGDALAFQVKIPVTAVYTTLDFYWQLPSSDGFLFVGLGAELSISPALYIAVTRYLNESVFVTFTPRILSQFDNLAVNPQVAFGLDTGAVEIAAFAGYQHIFGEGIEFDIDFDSDTTDRRNDFAIVGLSLRL